MLKDSFIPSEKIKTLQDLHRNKKKLGWIVTSEKKCIIRVFENANIKLSSFVSDSPGGTTTYLINGLLEWRKDLEKHMSECYQKKFKSTPEQSVTDINGRLTPLLMFLLKSKQMHFQSVEEQLAEVVAKKEHPIKEFELEVVFMQTILDIGKEGAIGNVTEIWVDKGVFPSKHNLALHSGMCPSNNESASKKKIKNPAGE
ncbi:MAG: hypothetical protein GYA62_06695, partial [Bacteroidales bacterium]|nr:hypothetical protein [Bacteroidales bacterium]